TGTVTIVYEPECLVVRIADDGVGPRADGGSTDEDHDGGTGIAGMRTRAEALGGVLAAGAGPITGFVVEAVLPIPAEAPASAEEPT
ncbi:MAG TPA: sensor histidine kinase, partial [Micromonosporaceae bacterium]